MASAFKVKPKSQFGVRIAKNKGLNYFPLLYPNLNIILIYVKGLLPQLLKILLKVLTMLTGIY